LSLSEEEIIEFLDSLEKETKAIKNDLLQVCWYMRGSISYEESMFLSHSERNIISKIIESNLETTKKSGMPFY
jgi:hypothetical protein